MHLHIELHRHMCVSSDISNHKNLFLSIQAVLEKRWWLVCIKSICVWRATSALQPSILGSAGNTLQHTASHCNTPHHTATQAATHCNTLKHTRCVTLQHTAIYSLCGGPRVSTSLDPWFCWYTLYTTTHCNCNTHCNTLQQNAPHCNTLCS